jgi:hypothetical protein
MGELVDQDQRRVALECGVEIELGEPALLILDSRGGQYFEALQQRLGLFAPVRLDDADQHVLAVVAQGPPPPPASRRSCRPRPTLRNRCAVARARGALLRLDLREELIGIRTLVLHAGCRAIGASVAARSARDDVQRIGGVLSREVSVPRDRGRD